MVRKIKAKEKKNIWQKIWLIIINTILVFFLLIGLLVLFSIVPIKNNYKVLAVMSGSMEPAITTGSLLITKPVAEYKIGDIITFQSGNKKADNTTHRIAQIEEQNGQKIYTTKGDANKNPDEQKISQDKIVGKQVFSISLVGYLIGYVKTLPGLLLIIIIPATIIVYEEFNNIKKEFKTIFANKKKARKNEKK